MTRLVSPMTPMFIYTGLAALPLRDYAAILALFPLSPQVVILEIGTNYLTRLRPEVTGSEIEELVRLLLDSFSVRVIGVCEVLPRARAPFFNDAALIFNHYLGGVLEPIPNVFCWRHRGFDNPLVHPYLPDGVHVNSFGQYRLYHSYRGAILKALRMLSS